MKDTEENPPPHKMGTGRGESEFVVHTTQSYHFFASPLKICGTLFEKYISSPFIPAIHKVYLRCYSVFHNSCSLLLPSNEL